MTRTLAHVSDLHLGRDAETDAAVADLCHALVAADPEAVLVTGDVTHRGRDAELDLFRRLFAPLDERLVVVPGNHDRLGGDLKAELMAGGRVQAELRPGMFVVRLDSTGAHNRRWIASHGALTADDVTAVERAVEAAPAGVLVVLMLHHHLLPLPEDHLGERLATLLGWPNAAELELGRELVERLRGRCDLVLHGHRHAPGEVVLLPRAGRPMRILNAGSTPAEGRARLITHAAGRVLADRWLYVEPRHAPRELAALRPARGARAAA
jgi:3',5'-cyclic-AMP phosphodiesterase